eukprot:scaffold7328_cov314-Pinguiococcus_pyrenoidosus.AAC.53
MDPDPPEQGHGAVPQSRSFRIGLCDGSAWRNCGNVGDMNLTAWGPNATAFLAAVLSKCRWLPRRPQLAASRLGSAADGCQGTFGRVRRGGDARAARRRGELVLRCISHFGRSAASSRLIPPAWTPCRLVDKVAAALDEAERKEAELQKALVKSLESARRDLRNLCMMNPRPELLILHFNDVCKYFGKRARAFGRDKV